MQGACSNQIVKCIIYTSDIEVGINKLLEIETPKTDLGLKRYLNMLFKISLYWFRNRI